MIECSPSRSSSALGKADPRRHLPDVSTFNGILDLCSLFCLLELGNVLSTWSYGKEDELERRRLMYARKRARILRHWLFQQYQLWDAESNLVNYEVDFYWPYLVQQAKALKEYKRKACLQDIGHRDVNEPCTPTAVAKVIENSLRRPEALWAIYSTEIDTLTSFAWGGPTFSVTKFIGPMIGE